MNAHRRWILWGGITFSLTLLGLGSYFAYIGLEQADKLASILGFFVGSLGLAISILLALLPGNGNTSSNTTAPGRTDPSVTPPSADGELANNLSNNHFHGPAAIINGDHGRQQNRFG
ncbi:hypothetical protein ACFYRY_42740 [Streptomyces sp. NPDC005263]|uniref:hypothetical protein n=1 Tax=Streptomyces sp. NPDC005263 TaxID=3364711 RepID=UPI0036CB8987